MVDGMLTKRLIQLECLQIKRLLFFLRIKMKRNALESGDLFANNELA